LGEYKLRIGIETAISCNINQLMPIYSLAYTGIVFFLAYRIRNSS
jgi:hypothetical protein